MSTGHATIRGRTTSLSGKTVSKYSPQYKSITGQEASDRGTTSYEIATANLINEQKTVAATLGLTKAQVLALNSRQLSNLSANIGRYNASQIAQLKKMYGNVSTHQLIVSGQAVKSGLMSNLERQQYLQALQSKRYQGNVQSGQAPQIISSKEYGKVTDASGNSLYSNYFGTPREYNNRVRSYDSKQSERWDSSQYTVKNLMRAVHTQGDWNYVLNIAYTPTSGLSGVELKRIKVAREYIIKSSGNSVYSKQFKDIDSNSEYNKYYNIATQKINSRLEESKKEEIREAREWIIEHSKNKGSLKELFAQTDEGSNKDKNVKQYESNIKTAEEKEQRLKEYQARLKKEDVESALKVYAGDSKLKQALADIYEATYDLNNISKTVSEYNRKTEYKVTRKLIEKPVSKVTNTKTFKKLEAEMQKNSSLKVISDFVSDEYEDLTKKPLTYAAETIALAGVGKAFKYGGKVLKFATEKGTTKLVGKTIAEKSLKISKKNITFAGKNVLTISEKKIVVKSLPMIVIDSAFVAQIGSQYIENSAGYNPITKENLELTKELVVMGIGAKAGSKSKSTITEKIKSAKIRKAARLPSDYNYDITSFAKGKPESVMPKFTPKTKSEIISKLKTDVAKLENKTDVKSRAAARNMRRIIRAYENSSTYDSARISLSRETYAGVKELSGNKIFDRELETLRAAKEFADAYMKPYKDTALMSESAAEAAIMRLNRIEMKEISAIKSGKSTQKNLKIEKIRKKYRHLRANIRGRVKSKEIKIKKEIGRRLAKKKSYSPGYNYDITMLSLGESESIMPKFTPKTKAEVIEKLQSDLKRVEKRTDVKSKQTARNLKRVIRAYKNSKTYDKAKISLSSETYSGVKELANIKLFDNEIAMRKAMQEFAKQYSGKIKPTALMSETEAEAAIFRLNKFEKMEIAAIKQTGSLKAHLRERKIRTKYRHIRENIKSRTLAGKRAINKLIKSKQLRIERAVRNVKTDIGTVEKIIQDIPGESKRISEARKQKIATLRLKKARASEHKKMKDILNEIRKEKSRELKQFDVTDVRSYTRNAQSAVTMKDIAKYKSLHPEKFKGLQGDKKIWDSLKLEAKKANEAAEAKRIRREKTLNSTEIDEDFYDIIKNIKIIDIDLAKISKAVKESESIQKSKIYQFQAEKPIVKKESISTKDKFSAAKKRTEEVYKEIRKGYEENLNGLKETVSGDLQLIQKVESVQKPEELKLKSRSKQKISAVEEKLIEKRRTRTKQESQIKTRLKTGSKTIPLILFDNQYILDLKTINKMINNVSVPIVMPIPKPDIRQDIKPLVIQAMAVESVVKTALTPDVKQKIQTELLITTRPRIDTKPGSEYPSGIIERIIIPPVIVKKMKIISNLADNFRLVRGSRVRRNEIGTLRSFFG